jgi:cytochrome c-type biogenesis protein CcmE
MAAIVAIVFAVAAGFAFVAAIFVIVIIGVHREERYLTFSNKTAPGAVALLARIVLGRYVRKQRVRRQHSRHPDDLASSREPSLGPRR